MKQEQGWTKTNKQKEKYHLMHVEVATAFPWLSFPPDESSSPPSSQQGPACPAPIFSILPIYSAATTLASSRFPKHTGAFASTVLTPGMLFPPEAHLVPSLTSFRSLLKGQILQPPSPASFFPLVFVPKHLLYFSSFPVCLFY